MELRRSHPLNSVKSPRRREGDFKLIEDIGLPRLVKYDAFDHTVNDKCIFYKSLEFRCEHNIVPHASAFEHQHQLVAGHNGTSELDAIKTTQPDSSCLCKLRFLRIVRAQLSRRFTHQYARHQWAIRKMATDPKIFFRDISESNGVLVSQHADSIKQHHFMTVRIYLHDGIAINDYLGQIKF